jgi:putative ABC transport system ATP-binding protein
MSVDAPITYRLREVRKRREKGGTVFELQVPSLNILRGEFVAVLGPSGCGKSTLLDMLALVLRPTSATELSVGMTQNGVHRLVNALAMDEKHRARARKRHIGYVLQNGGLLPFLNVRDNILLTCRINHIRGREEGVNALGRRLGILDQLAKKPAHLSAGQRQRAAIARALVHAPAIVLADEPTASVDKLSAIEIRDTFGELIQETGTSLLMVTHDEALARGAADRILTFRIDRTVGGRTVSRLVEEEDRHGCA